MNATAFKVMEAPKIPVCIEDNVAIPETRGCKAKWTAEINAMYVMKVGQSFVITRDDVKEGAIKGFKNRIGWQTNRKFRFARDTKHVNKWRIWRTA